MEHIEPTNQPPNPVDGDDVEILEPGTIHKDNIDNEIADLNNNGEREWNDRKNFYVKKNYILEHQLEKERPEKKERFTKRKNVKKNMKNNKKNEVDKNKKVYRKMFKEIEREFDSEQRRLVQNERMVSLMSL